VTDVEEDAMSNEDKQTAAVVEDTAEVEEDVLVEDVSIDGMCGVY
jgi:mycofactocin precursor